MKNNNIDLSVDFCGFHLRSPFLLASAPPAANGEMIIRAFDAGWAGAATKTLALKPTPNVEPRFASSHSGKKLVGFENIEQITDIELDVWLLDIEKIKKKYPDRLLIVSIMATDDLKEWQELTMKVQSAGADMIELNLSCPHMAKEGLGSDVGQDPALTTEAVRMVKEVSIVPIIAKLTPNVTDIVSIGNAAKHGGVDALSAINTVSALMGIDLDTMEPKPSVKGHTTFGGLSGSYIKPIALRDVVKLAKGTMLPISGIGGIMNWKDAAEFLMCGSITLQIGTAVMNSGYAIIKDLESGLSKYLKEKNIKSVKDIIGIALPKIHDRLSSLDFAHKVIANIDLNTCIRCDLCYIACRDGAYIAIEVDDERSPTIIAEKCDGCSLCVHVCPVPDCITMEPVQGR